MQLCVDWNAGHLVTERGEPNSPGQIRRFAPATSGGKTSLPAQHVAQCYPGRARVGGLPPGQFPTSHQDVSGNNGANQATIEDAARTQKIEREKQTRILTILGFRKQH